MGVYLNPGNRRFQRACNSKIYVDKTAMIDLTNSLINTEQNCICISRPRRFGKSITASMLTAYYGKECDSSELFAHYKISKCDSYLDNLNQFNVIALNMQDFLSMTKDVDELTAQSTRRIKRAVSEFNSGRRKFSKCSLGKII